MADTKAARAAADNGRDEGKTYTVKNTARGPRYVNNIKGQQVSIAPGGQQTVVLSEGEAKATKRHPDFEVSAGKAAAPAPAPEQQEQEQQEQTDTTVATIAHESFGKYFGYNAAGEKVEGVGPFDKAAAQAYATENKVEFKASDAS